VAAWTLARPRPPYTRRTDQMQQSFEDIGLKQRGLELLLEA
jgi:hypothetical protein